MPPPPPPKIFWILNPLSPLSWVSESYRQDIGQFQVFSSDEALQSGELFHQGQFQCCSQNMEQGESKPFSRFKIGKFVLLLKVYLS